MTAVFISPEHRRKGVAGVVIQGAVDFAWAEVKRSRMRIMFLPTNAVVREPYSSLGFEDAGQCNFVEAMIAHGDSNLVLEDGGKSNPEKYLLRAEAVMEKVTE